MPDPPNPSYPLPQEAVEAAAKAIWDAEHVRDSIHRGRVWETAQELETLSYPQNVVHTRWQAQTAIHAFLDAMEVTVEREQPARFACRQCQEIANHQPRRYRLVSDWFPIKGPVDE